MTEQPQRKGARLGGGPATVSTRDDATEPELPPRRPVQPEPATEPQAAPDGTFAAATPGGTQLVPTGPAAPAPTVPPVNGQQPADQPQQGPAYTIRPPRPPAAERPSAADILQPREKIEREQISAMVPAQLQLINRMRLFWALESIEQRDQVAFALDEWLTARGY